MPFKSKAQMRKCFAADDPDWDCEEWAKKTPKDIPEKVDENLTFEEKLDIIFETPLTTKKRNALDDSSFALPGRRYPIHDKSHARNALSRVAQHGTPDEKTKVRAAVHRKYPDIGAED